LIGEGAKTLTERRVSRALCSCTQRGRRLDEEPWDEDNEGVRGGVDTTYIREERSVERFWLSGDWRDYD
jgi:hypothetical protein